MRIGLDEKHPTTHKLIPMVQNLAPGRIAAIMVNMGLNSLAEIFVLSCPLRVGINTYTYLQLHKYRPGFNRIHILMYCCLSRSMAGPSSSVTPS
ncbi:hypothetical protein EON63_00775 [archaeon]|nr:MAG: hypothetical protein EON63_00775 [archaeon]